MTSSILKPSSARPSCQNRHKVSHLHTIIAIKCESAKKPHTLGDVLQANIQHRIIQGPAHQKLQAQVIHSFGIAVRLTLLRPVPVSDETVAKGKARSRISGDFVAVEHASGEGGFHMAHNFLFEPVSVSEAGYLVSLPGFPLRLGDGGCKSISCSLRQTWVLPSSTSIM